MDDFINELRYAIYLRSVLCDSDLVKLYQDLYKEISNG